MVDFVAAADAQGAPTEEEEGDVGAERGGNFHQPWGRNGAANEAQIPKQGRSSIAGTAAEAAPGGNFFAEFNFDAGANVELPPQCIHGCIDQILADGLQGKGLISLNSETNTGSFGRAQFQFIVQGNGLEDGAEFVVSVRAFAKNVQPEIDFSEGWDSDFAHAAIVAWLLALKISELCDVWFGRASSRFQRSCRFRRRRAEHDAIRRGISPTRRRRVRCGRAWRKRHRGVNGWWDRDCHDRRPGAGWLRLR